MKPAPFLLHRPATLAQALDLLARTQNARIIAGGQSLMPMLAMRLALPDNLIDLNRITELSYIREDSGAIVIGAMTRQRDIEFSPLIATHLPLLREAILQVGHRQTRNRGTIGGSLCHLDPSAEMPAVMVALDAMLVAESARGRRELPMAQFAEGLMTTSLAPDEVLTQIRVQGWSRAHGAHFVEFARRHGDFAVVSAAAMIELDRKRRIARVALALGGVAAMPFRASAAERALVGQSDSAAFARAAQTASDGEALNDPAFPAWYRRRLAVALLVKAIDGAYARAIARSTS
jgi:carbon-monoxide dehydrogenase medium subunit